MRSIYGLWFKILTSFHILFSLSISQNINSIKLKSINKKVNLADQTYSNVEHDPLINADLLGYDHFIFCYRIKL